MKGKSVTDTAGTLVDVLTGRAAQQGDQVGFTFVGGDSVSGESLTYAELDHRARALASTLRERVAPGARVLLALPAGLDYVAAFFGCLYAGAIAVPAYPPTRAAATHAAQRLRAIAASARPEIAIATTPVADLPVIAPATEPDAAQAWVRPPITDDTVAFLQYTSGSTASSRGVIVRHANLLHNSATIGERFGTGADTVGCSWLPPFHDMGLIGGILHPICVGFPMLLMSPASFARNPSHWLKVMAHHRVTVGGGPDFGYRMCLTAVPDEAIEGLDLSAWRVAFTGAEPVRAATLAQFAARFAPAGFDPAAFHPCYGLAESTLMVTAGRPGRPPVVRGFAVAGLRENRAVPETVGDIRELVGCGTAAGGGVMIVDPSALTRCEPGEVGEIWVRGPSVAGGYWERAEETERVFDGVLADGDRGYLRTGDLGFQLDGELFVTGRSKDLIVVHGANHYPQDLERTAEQSHPAILQVGAAFSIETGEQERVVLAHEVHRHTPDGDLPAIADAVRAALTAEHEVQPHAVVLVRQGGIPRTSSGKIQRAATRERYLAGTLPVLVERVFTQPAQQAAPSAAERVPGALAVALGLLTDHEARRTLIAAHLREQVARLAGVPVGAVDPARTIHAYGLDSLTSLRLADLVEADLGVAMPTDRALGPLSLAELADLVADAPTAHQSDVDPGDDAALPLLPTQQRMWLVERLLGGDAGHHHLVTGLRVRGPFDLAAFRTANTALLGRHEALRIAISAPDGVPVQVVRPLGAPVIDLLTGAAEVETAVARLESWAARPFDLAEPPLLRAAVVPLADDEHLIGFAVHHLACDGMSLPILLRDLAECYAEARAGRTPLAARDGYRDVVLARHRERSPAGLDYWTRRLAGTGSLDLPLDRARPAVLDYRAGRVDVALGAELSARLAAFAAEENTTLFAALLAFWQLLLGRYAGQTDVAVGSPVALRSGRTASAVVGCLFNTVVLRTDLADVSTFRHLLRRVGGTVADAIAHQDVPFERVLEGLQVRRHANRGALFDAIFTLRPDLSDADVAAAFDGARTETVELDNGAAECDIALELRNGDDGVRGVVRYLACLFDRPTVDLLARRLVTLLSSVATDPDRALSEVDLLLPGERALLGVETAGLTPAPAVEPVQAPIERHAAEHPDDIAVRAGDGVLTYAELDRAAASAARALRTEGVRPGDRVLVLLDRSTDLVVALLAVLKAGGAFVPLEPGVPAARIAQVATEAGAVLVLTRSQVSAGLVELPCRVSTVDTTGPAEPLADGGAFGLAYVMFTSGSTGRPKGVAVSHREFGAYLTGAERQLAPRRGDEHAMISTVGADICLTPLFTSLRTGGCLRLLSEAEAVDPAALAARFRERRPEFLKIAPSHLSALLGSADVAAMLPTGLLVLSGEPVPWALIDRVANLAPDVTVLNEYGPTETVVASLVHRLRVSDDPATRPPSVPIGDVFGGNRAYVLDEALRPVPSGIAGELYLGGDQVVPGYLDRFELTAERFVADPFGAPGARMYRTGDLARRRATGLVEYLGRVDDQVKVHGFRVEPGEIAGVLREHPELDDAAVIAQAAEHGDHELIAFACRSSGPVPAPPALRAYLRSRLPAHMVPAGFVALDGLPFTANGKLDRSVLRALAAKARAEQPAATASGGKPVDDVERELLSIWEELLDGRRVGTHDNFFDVGGHSLLLVRMHHLISERLRLEVPVVELVNHPTISDQASFLRPGPRVTPLPEEAGRARADARIAARQARQQARSGDSR